MEMYQTIPTTHTVTTFLLKAAEIKLVNQVSWPIKNIPKVVKIPHVPMHSSSRLQMCDVDIQ